MHSEEERAGGYWSVLEEDSTWNTELSLQSLVRASD